MLSKQVWEYVWKLEEPFSCYHCIATITAGIYRDDAPLGLEFAVCSNCYATYVRGTKYTRWMKCKWTIFDDENSGHFTEALAILTGSLAEEPSSATLWANRTLSESQCNKKGT